jgi:thiol:disulfide interchange protein DsbC
MRALLLALAASLALPAFANEAAIRKNIAERLPQLPKIDEVRPAAMPGLWEVRFGGDIRYTDPTGSFFIEGDLIDLKAKKNLTEERITQMSKVDFASLPLKDAVVWKNGNGKRKVAIFADPNCGYCKRFEAQLQEMKDITVYTFVIPILGGDSADKSRAIWCAKDSTAAWLGWMLRGEAAPAPAATCDGSAIERNSALATRLFVKGTPAIILPDGNRIPGAVSAPELDRRLSALSKS